MELDFRFLFKLLEMVGTIAFAVSGAMVAIEKRVDLFGVLLLGITTAVGGGMLRDLILGQNPPACFSNAAAVTVAAGVSLAVFLVARIFQERYLAQEPLVDRINNVFDAVGLGIFTITGIQAAVEAGFSDRRFLCVCMGMFTAIGGGLLRDLMLREIPFVLKKRVYALASILGGALYVLMTWSGIPFGPSFLISAGLVFLIRMLATTFKWNLPKAIR